MKRKQYIQFILGLSALFLFSTLAASPTYAARGGHPPTDWEPSINSVTFSPNPADTSVTISLDILSGGSLRACSSGNYLSQIYLLQGGNVQITSGPFAGQNIPISRDYPGSAGYCPPPTYSFGQEGTWSGAATFDTSGLANGTYNLTFQVYNQAGIAGTRTASFAVSHPAPPPAPATVKVSSNLSTGWTITGPRNYSGSGTSANYPDAEDGTYSISADNLSCYSKSITPSSSQSVGYGDEITFYITYSYNCGGGTPPPGGDPPPPPGEPPPPTTVPPPPSPQPVPPTCSSAAAYKPVTDDTSGAFYLYAYGVQNASFLYFPTWTDAGGQDDIVWYPGSYIGNNTWMATVNLANHPGYGTVNSHVYMGNAAYWPVFCGTANFTKNQPNNPPVGVFDNSDYCSILGGWAFDPDTPNPPGEQLAIHIYEGGPAGSGNFVTNTVTTGLRPDVNAAYGISGNHGWTIYTPAAFRDNAVHQVYAHAIDSNPAGGTNPVLTASPKAVGPCPPLTPSADISAAATSVAYNVGTIISWESNNVTSCSISPPGWTGLGGNESTGPLTTTTTYTLSCSGPYGSASDSVTVTVGQPPQTLTTSIAAGSGSITGTGISCPGDCSESYDYGTNVTLTGTPSVGYGPVVWGGACSGTGSCTVSMTQARSVTASFALTTNTLTTSIAAGSGSITGTGISCPGDCSESYNYGTNVTLNANPGSGYSFSYWGGACAGVPNSSCTVSMTQARSVSVGFTLNAYTLTTSIAAGSGSITGTGISCPGDCSESYNYGTGVTLTANPSTDYVFSGWSGNCSGGSTVCNLTIDAAKTANASFTYVPPFNYSLSNSGNSNAPKTSGTVYAANTITKTLLAGTTQPVTLSVSGLPAGVSVYSISNNPCNPNPTCTSTITLAVAPSTQVGPYLITVTGSPLSKITQFNLVVTGAPISVVCSANPTTALLGQNVTWSANIVGGIEPRTYRWTGIGIPTSPAPSTNPYTRSYSTIGQKTAQLTVTGADGAQSTCPPAAVQINFDPTFEEF